MLFGAFTTPPQPPLFLFKTGDLVSVNLNGLDYTFKMTYINGVNISRHECPQKCFILNMVGVADVYSSIGGHIRIMNVPECHLKLIKSIPSTAPLITSNPFAIWKF